MLRRLYKMNDSDNLGETRDDKSYKLTTLITLWDQDEEEKTKLAWNLNG